MLQEDLTSSNSNSFHQEYSSGVEASSQEHWRHEKIYSDDFTQIISQQNLTATFQVECGTSTASHELNPPWNKFSQFLKTSPPNTPLWNASTPVATTSSDSRSSFFPETSSFDEKPKKTSEVRNMGTTTKKNNMEISSKRPRNETPSHLPSFKVRKEKMGDRITALQQLVSPFGKTDTASVLSEVYENIRFLHEQIHMLSTPYMKIGASIHHQQSSNKSKDRDRPRQDLRSRGLCVVPVFKTFPMTHETTIDFWTPTFGGTLR
ncbi:hypothetical protein ACJIZ3_006232 [Penstemon smallii]|uniref:BHLH domain-containing protein n=1 Tax=Penstemon smallii TaxID=265156 RepID=A0ABD3S7G8_9LAMI